MLALLVRTCRDEGERKRRLPAQVLTAMHEARLFRMYIPKARDSLEIDPITSMIVVEEIAPTGELRADLDAAHADVMRAITRIPDQVCVARRSFVTGQSLASDGACRRSFFCRV